MKNPHAHIRAGLLELSTEAIDTVLAKFAGVRCVSGGVTMFEGRPGDGDCQRWLMILELVEQKAGAAEQLVPKGEA